MSSIWTVARREVKALFDQPTGYILLVIFVGVNNFLFFRQAYLFDIASLRPMLELLPWLLLIFVPAITMGTLAEDVRGGTVEVVLSHPITELEYLIGKYVGRLLFVWSGIGITLFIPIGLSLGADLHVGVVVAQYFGTALLAGGLVAIGVWSSSLTKNQVTAFMVSVLVVFVLVLVGLDPLLLGLPPVLASVAARLGVLSHFRDIARGVIDLRDVIYFATLAAVFLSLAYGGIMRRKLSVKGEALPRLRLGVAIIVASLVVINLFGNNIGGRLDLTPGRAYTLSAATRDIVRNAEDLVTIKLFISDELPPEVALLRRDLDDLLRDFRSASDGNVRLVVRDPAEDEDVEAEARSLGIHPVQFNVMGESQFTVRDGYLGLAVQYADQTETIPIIQRTDDLEYRLASFVNGMVDTTKAKVGFFVAESEQLPGSGYQTVRQSLSQSYDVQSFTLTSDSSIPLDAKVLLLIGSPDSLSVGQKDRMQQFFEGGGSALVFASGMAIGEQQFATARPVVWNEVLEPFGVSIRSNMVYDLMSAEQVSMRTSFGMLLRSYPLWLRARSTGVSPVNRDIETIFAPWTSEIDTSGVTEGTVIPLFTSSRGGGVESDFVMIDPNREFGQESLGEHLIAAMVNPLAVDEPTGPSGRVAVVGTSLAVSDQYLRNAPSNVAFALNVVDWLAQDDALMSIRAKNRNPPTLVFSSDAKRTFVRYLNVFGIPLIVAAAAVLRMLKRRQTTQRTYEPVTKGAVT